DDLQWADAASLRLVERLATHPDSNYLLIVGAFRDNEVPASHPTTICLDAIARAGVPVDDIHLGRLSEAHVRELLVDALRLPREQSASLSELAAICQDKTHANPFFLRQFLQDLHTDGLINWSDEVGHFTWDDGAIADAAVTDNVVDYLAARVRRLDLRERDLLRLAAALGTTFDLEAVAAVAPDLDHDWEAAVASAVRFGLVLPLGRGESTPRSGTEVRAARRFVFSHDRVQQAAYDLTPEPDRPRLHLAIGRSLQSALSDADDGQLFEVVEHLNRGLEVMTDPEERAEVAALDRRAGVLALRSAAPREALGFFQHALGALASNAWSADYRGTLSLHELACEAALLSGEEGTMRSLAATVAERARDALDTVAVKEIGIAQRKSVRDLAGAVEESLALLAELGVTFSQSTSDVVVLRELVRTKIALRGKAMAALEALPVLTDPRREAAMRVLGTLLPAAYYVRPGLLPFITFELVRMSVEHGVTPTSAYGFSVYGLLLCTLGDHEQGYAVGAMAVRLGERLGDPRLHNVSLHLFQAHIRFWREPLRACADVGREVHRMGVELGDYEYAAFGAMMHCNMSVFTGDPLERVRETHRIYGAAVGTLQQQTSQQQHAMTAQLVDNLILPDAGGAALKGPHYDESVMLAQLEADGDATLLYVHHAVKLVLAVFFADAATAKTHREALARYAKAAASSIWTFVGESYALLAELMLLHPPASARGRELRGPRRAAALLSVMRGRLRLAKWARGCPANFAHRLALVDAEIARVRGRHGEAMEAYGRAFELARAAGLSGDEGLACELAARFYESIDQAVAARAHLARARYAYGRWGAGAKVARLDRELARSKKVPGEASQASPTTFHTTLRASDAQIDLAAVMRAARAISEPVVVEELLERLMQTLVESAGAQRGVLVLLVDGEARVEAVAESKKEIRVGPPVPLSDFDEASEPVIRYVLRMEEPLVIADARDPGDFHDDRYLARGRTRSVLCVPIVGQGRPLAAVYLENNLSADAFTPARTEVVSMLASQAAVSLENARLYAVLDHKVKQRTAELELRNRFIRETFGRYLSDKVVDSLLQSPEGLAMGGETRTVTVLMADLRGFIAKTQGLPPERVVQLVNVFLSAMTEVILRHGGTIDEFIGDAILVIFGAPVLGEDDASRAVRCALEMQREMVAVNEQNRALGLPEVEMGIGLSTGEVVVGNIGSERRAKYGVVGATVNLASRIESFTRGGDILLPDSTKASLDYDLVITASFEVTLKGHARPVALHRVVGIAGEPETLLSPRTAPLTRLPRPLDVSYRRVAENTLSAQSLRGRIVALSRDRAAIEAEHEEAAFRDLCLRLGEHDVYAKVEPPDEAREATFVVWFTSVDPQARALVEAQLGARDD
ncbi:MAG: GAF domain-containing protein, partial [Myxococcales bacterium]|nr:GAF domain-containing protein [Myxococcales bacterium]